MEKEIIFLLLVFLAVNISIAVNYSFAQNPQYFSPFQYGVKTVKGVHVLYNEGLKNEIRKKAAELLNSYYNTTTFTGESLKNPTPEINKAVKDAFGGWRNLLKEATELVFASSTILFNLNLQKYVNWQVVNLDITPDGKLEKIYIAPAEYLEGLPTISPCTKGIGQCILFIFDRGLRILYTLSLALGVLLLMWAGILYITQPTESSKIHQRVQWGLIGIVVSITSFTIVIALERWLVMGLPTTPSGVSYTTEREDTETEEIGNIVYIRSVQITPPEILITYDYRGEENCHLTITGVDDKGRSHNIADNYEVTPSTPGKFGLMKFTFTDLNISEMILYFEEGTPPSSCKTNIAQYTAKVGEKVKVSDSVSVRPKLIIDQTTARIDKEGRFTVFVSVLPEDRECELSLTFYNISKGHTIDSPHRETIKSEQIISKNIKESGSLAEPEDTIRVIFKSPNCDLNIGRLDLAYQKPLPTSTEEKLPELKIAEDKIRIYASQYIRIEIPDNLKDALEQLLGFAVLQRNIYQPPFTMYIEYSVEPADRSGSCTLYGVMRGTSISSLSADKTKAASLYVFNRDFQITLNYEKNKKRYVVAKYISPPNNTLGFLYINFYDYKGRCEVKFYDSRKIDEFKDHFERVFDIETGKVYLPEGSGWDVIKKIIGL